MTERFDDLRLSVLRRIAPVLRSAGVDEHEVACSVGGRVADLDVELRGPAAAAGFEHALGVRVLDAVHADGRTFGPVRVHCRFR
jgi:hypothetical protein